MTKPDKRFKVALSFPGEHRDFVAQVANHLAGKVGRERVLYDKFYEAEFARVDLDVYLPDLYRTQSELVAVFLCAEYAKKRWCKLEWRFIRQLICTAEEDRIMLLSFDDIGPVPEIGILSGDGYVSIGRRPSDQIAGLILQRLGTVPNPSPDTRAQIAPTRLRHGAEHLFGREKELAALDRAWEDPGTHIVTIVAWGGVGKTSLVVEWMARKAKAGWPGFEGVFDWSFYSQGTREQGAASADAFVSKALEFFGDEGMAKSAASPWDKGSRLAQLVAQRRTLLVLDGLEPLQYPPGPLTGKLKDPALEALLKGLAQQNPGLCMVTTRERVADLAPFRDTTAPQWDLEYLSEEAGAALLHRAGATRAGAASIKANDSELRAASREVNGHALTLRLLGGYLALTAGGDIRKRDTIEFDEADREYKTNPADADKLYGHAFKMMTSYEKWLAGGGQEGLRQLAVLRLLGLFDRPASANCLGALRKKPDIAGLTEPLVSLNDAQWKAALQRLADCGLIADVAPSPPGGGEGRGEGVTIDAHPLIREYFARQLHKKNLDGWRLAHRRVYEHLRDSTKDKPQPTLEDLEPLYQAVAHGCQAGLHQQAYGQVYQDRIVRGNAFFNTRKLGAFGADLGAVACFFEQPWSKVSPALSESASAWLLAVAAFDLGALGRLTEALEPMRGCIRAAVDVKTWDNAARGAGNLSELELTLGLLPDAIRDAEQSVTFADRSSERQTRVFTLTTLADALHQAGRRDEALKHFREAEKLQAENQPQYSLLYSFRGFHYCDLLLAEAERAAWRTALNLKSEIRDLKLEKVCREVERRAGQTLKWGEAAREASLLDIALDHLTLARAARYCALLTDSKSEQAGAVRTAHKELTAAVEGLRRSGNEDEIPRALFSRAWLRFVEGDAGGARTDLDEAWQIAERGAMRLYMADVHLYRARLFHAVRPYPWGSAKDDLAAARKLIAECGYHRRDEELADAEKGLADRT
ncbi:MAG: hypothetical protein V1790_14380 [Planctomycetota bacterium]